MLTSTAYCMEIALIDAEGFLWEADKNMRVLSINDVLKKIRKYSNPNQIYFIGGFESKDPFNEVLKKTVDDNSDLPLIPVPAKDELDGRRQTAPIVVDLLYRTALSQKEVCDTDIIIAVAETSSLRAAKLLADRKFIRPVSYILPDSIDIERAKKLVNVIDTISLSPGDMGLEEKLIIREIVGIITSDSKEEVPFVNTISSIINKCEAYSSIKPEKSRQMVLSLIHNGFLKRVPFINSRGGIKTGVFVTDKLQKLITEE